MARKPTETEHDPATGEIHNQPQPERDEPGADTQNFSEKDLIGEENEYIIRSKMSAKDLGNPRKGAALEEGQSHIVGFISGTASAVKNEMLPDGNASYSLTGGFEGESPDGKVKIRTGRLFLPGGIHEIVCDTVRKTGSATFSFEIRTKPAKNPIGYEYDVVSLIKMETGHNRFGGLLAARRAKLGLTAPTGS